MRKRFASERRFMLKSKTYYHDFRAFYAVRGPSLQQRLRSLRQCSTNGSISHADGRVNFVLEEEGRRSLPVSYVGRPIRCPSTFKDGVQALVEGRDRS